MKKYSAAVKDGQRIVFIKDQEYQRKSDFIHDLRNNGYKVNPKKVKESDLFEYIINHTNCNPWDWDLKEIPKNEDVACETESDIQTDDVVNDNNIPSNDKQESIPFKCECVCTVVMMKGAMEMTKREIAKQMQENGLACYVHSDIATNGTEYISFMPYGERLDYHGLRCGYGITIWNDHNKNTCEVSETEWKHGYPYGGKTLYKGKEETISDSEVFALLERLGIEIKRR